MQRICLSSAAVKAEPLHPAPAAANFCSSSRPDAKPMEQGKTNIPMDFIKQQVRFWRWGDIYR